MACKKHHKTTGGSYGGFVFVGDDEQGSIQKSDTLCSLRPTWASMCFLLFLCVAAQPSYCTVVVGCMIVWDRNHWNVCMYTMKTCTHSLSLTHNLAHPHSFKIKSSQLRSNIDLLPIFKIFSPMSGNHGDRYYCQTSVLLHSDLNTQIYSRWPSGLKKIRETHNHTHHAHTHVHSILLCVCLHILKGCTLSLCMCTFPIMCMSSFFVVWDDCEKTEGGERGDRQHHGREEGICVRWTPPVFLSSRVTASKHARRQIELVICWRQFGKRSGDSRERDRQWWVKQTDKRATKEMESEK